MMWTVADPFLQKLEPTMCPSQGVHDRFLPDDTDRTLYGHAQVLPMMIVGAWSVVLPNP